MKSKIKPKVGDIVLIPCIVEANGISLDGHQVVELRVQDTLEFDSRLAVRFTCYNDCLISSESNKE